MTALTVLRHRAVAAPAAAALLSSLLAGCATTPQLTAEEIARQNTAIEALSADRPAYLKPYYAQVVRGGNRDAVRYWLDLGKAALDRGDREVAAEAFDEALKGITAVYADDAQAEKARSVWHEESVKDFKGEPYERAMAFLYRGVIDLMDGDYDNARAGFKGALLQDSFAETERYRQDFASAAWLVGWASHCLGDDSGAAEAFAEAREYQPDLPVPEKDDRLLVLMEAGQGPLKETWGEYNEKLAYYEQMPPADDYVVGLLPDGPIRPMWVAEDLFYQATTRGGRQMDDVLAQKADTKEVTGVVGGGMMVAGAGLMTSHDSNVAAAGAAVAIIGLLASAAASGMNAEADTRQWEGLPHSLYLTPMPLPKEPLSQESAGIFFASSGTLALSSLEGISATQQGTCGLIWVPSSVVQLVPPAPEGLVEPSTVHIGEGVRIEGR